MAESAVGAVVPSTASTASAALAPHVSLEGDDPSLTAEQRAAALVSRMTLEDLGAIALDSAGVRPAWIEHLEKAAT